MKENNSRNFLQAGTDVLLQLADYFDSSQNGKGKVVDLKAISLLLKEMNLEHWIRNGGMDMHTIRGFLQSYLDNSQHMHHPGYMGHQVATPHYASALADLIHGVTSNPMAIYEMGPAAASIELAIINWMLDKIGWLSYSDSFITDEKNGAGVLTNGGSLANLTALLAARAAIAPDAWEKGNPHDLVILCSPTAHYSISRAVSIMGMGSHSVIPLATDKNEIILTQEFETTCQQVKNSGKKIMAVVISACATSTGLYDDVDAIADFCNRHNIWLHVDGAHGMSAILSEREKHLLKGIEKANSVIWDAHKMLRTSTLCTAVLFRNQQAFKNIFQQKGSYIFYDREAVGFDFISHTVECTKSGLGTKLFWVLAFLGEKGLAAYVEEQFEKAKEFYKIISSRQGFECPFYPQSNIVCFRYGQNDRVQLGIRDKLLENGNYYITSTEINGNRYLRLSLMNPVTTNNTIEALLDEIENLAGIHYPPQHAQHVNMN